MPITSTLTISADNPPSAYDREFNDATWTTCSLDVYRDTEHADKGAVQIDDRAHRVLLTPAELREVAQFASMLADQIERES
ncbi:hypothetical protein [Kribbella deserti]|uniref:Uncharacterized protein n=1 Tax=Kribbella deserti TaxID=1926257 RepID=A0ABV6QNB3_9ACTN